MGGNHSNPFREGGQLMSEFTITNKNHELFLTYLAHNRNQKQYVLRELTYNEQRQYTINFQKVKNRKNIKNKHLTHLERIDERNEDNMCANFLKLYTLWEFSSKSLLDQIKQRGLQRKPFQNIQLWSILACSIMGLAALQQKDIRHQCLTTKAILMERDGNVKIVDPMAVGFQTNFQCVFNNRTLKNVYLSPQQCEAIQSQKPIINKNPFKNDVFTLGMILLQCGLLERQDQCYLDDCSRINWSKVEANISKFGGLYQQDLKQMLIIMLGKDIRSRPDWLDLDKFVKKNNNKNSSKFIAQTSSGRRRDHFIKRTAHHSLRPHKQNKISPQNIHPNPRQYQVSKFNPAMQPTPHNISQPPKQNAIVQYLPLSYIPPTHIVPNGLNQRIAPNDNHYIPNQSNAINTGNKSFLHGPSAIYQPQNRILSSNYQNAWKPNNQDPNILSRQTNFPNYQPTYNTNQSKTKAPNYNTVPVPTINQQPQSSHHFTNYLPNNYPLNNQPSNNYPVNNFSVKNYPLNNYSSLPAPIPIQQINFNNIVTGVTNERRQLLEYKESKAQKYQNSLQSIDRAHNTLHDYNNYSPINTSSYIRPAQSVNYEVIKAYSPVSQQENKNEAVTVPFDPKIIMTPQMSDKNNLTQLQPQYVQEHFKMGSRYEGYKLNGLRHGKGKFFYQDGGSYDGEWKFNKMEGFGTLYYQSNRKAYEGLWLNDQFQGKGKLFNQYPAPFQQSFDFNNFDEIDQYWQYYQGDFYADEKNGSGQLKFSNGELFEGTFKKDMVEGEGIFYCKDGRNIHGVWSQNHLVTILN